MSSKLLNYPTASANPHLGPSTTATGPSSSTTASSHHHRAAAHSSSAQLNFENLQLDDILCTVCQSVLVEPVFLPCQHRFCRNCLSGTIEKNNLNCPCCRKRFGTWYRNASRVNKLVHEQLWSAIQSQFRDYLEEDNGRCNGNGSVSSCFVPQSESVIHLSEPGEIRKEYENELQRYRKELIEEKKKELAASEKYIINLYKQEGIIDLVDSSDHLSISSSTTTPEAEAKEEGPQVQKRQPDVEEEIHEVEDDEEAGPSGSSFPHPMIISAKANATSQKAQGNQPIASAVSSTTNTLATRPATAKSISNGSVISISSTSSASAASSSCISSASSRYSLVKSATQQTGHNVETTKQQKAPGGTTHSKPSVAATKKVFTMADLNKSDLCVKPTKLHKRTSSQAANDEDDGDDGDSLRSELNHFKPILATTPKSCFSSKSVVRVPSVRPETGTAPAPGSASCLSPSKSPFKPIDPTTPRRSAFCVVNIHLFTPPTVSEVSRNKVKSSDSPSKKRTPPSSGGGSSSLSSSKKGKTKLVTPKTKAATAAASKRKRKLRFSPTPKAKVKTTNFNATDEVSNQRPTRVTRRSTNEETKRLKDLIVTDQQRRAEMIEQERRDFEFAQKLQKKLNRTRGATFTTFGILNPYAQFSPASTRSQNNVYHLRRNSIAHPPTTSSRKATESTSSGSSLSSEIAFRKRKQVTTGPEAERNSSSSNQRQQIAAAKRLRTVQPPAAIIPSNPAAAASADQPPEATSQSLRRSTRNRH